MEFDHILLSIIGDSERTGAEIGAALRARHGLDSAPYARIYTSLPGLERRGWVLHSGGADQVRDVLVAADGAEDMKGARRWSLSRSGRDRLERWLVGPGGRPAASRVPELLVVLACMPRRQPGTASLLRREIDRLEGRRLMRSALRRADPGALPGPLFCDLSRALARRAQGRRELWLAVLREWLRSLPASGYR